MGPFKTYLKRHFITSDCYKYVNRSLIIPKCVGLFPFDNELNFSSLYFCHSCIFLTFLTFGSLYITYFVYFKLNYAWNLSRYLNIFEILMSTSYVLVGFVLLISERQRFICVVENLYVIERKLAALGEEPQYNVFSGIIITYIRFVYITITFCLILVYSSEFIIHNGKSFFLYTYITLYFPIFSHLLIRPFKAVMSLINEQYSRINILLQRLSSTLDVGSRKKIEKLVSINTELYDVCDNLNGIYSWIIFMWMVSAFMIIVVNVYFICCTLIAAELYINGAFTHALFISYNNTTLWCTEVYNIIYTCNKVTKKSSLFHNELYKITLRDKYDHLGESDKLQTHFAFEPIGTFVACDYLLLDNSVIHAMVAAGSTYIVLLIQHGPGTI